MSGHGVHEHLRLEQEPPRIAGADLDALLVWAVEHKASDITFQTDEPVWAEIHGRNHAITRRTMTGAELVEIINQIYGANGAAQLSSGRDIDVSYEVRLDRRHRYRFRVNGTSILVNGHDGMQITMRSLPGAPVRIEELGVEPEIIGACNPRQGLVMVTGPTGSGKTTLLGSMMRMKLESPGANRKLLTYEAPIEIAYDSIKGPDSYVAQTEIPRHLPSFAAGVRNALRRKPSDILVGESRDPETMAASCEAALTGHAVYTTVHSNGVAETVRRMVSVFPAEERQGRAIDLCESLRLIVTQALLPTIDGRRVGAREFLVFDGEVRNALLAQPVDSWPRLSRDLVARRGQPMERAVRQIYDDGNGPISRKVCEQYVLSARLHAAAITGETLPAALGGEGIHVA